MRYLVAAICAVFVSGCANSHDLYLRNEVSGRIYGPLDSSRMLDRHIPEGQYMDLYPTRVSVDDAGRVSGGRQRTVFLRLAGATNDIPQSEWNSFEREFLLSPEFQELSERATGSTWWTKEDGKPRAIRISEMRPEGIVIERLGNEFLPLPWIAPQDIETHKVLTQTIIKQLNARQTPLSEVVESLRRQVPKLRERASVDIILDGSQGAKSAPITLSLRNIPLMDMIHYVCEVTGSSYSIEGNTVRIKECVQPAH